MLGACAKYSGRQSPHDEVTWLTQSESAYSLMPLCVFLEDIVVGTADNRERDERGVALEQLPSSLRGFVRFEQQGLWRPKKFRTAGADRSGIGPYLPECGAVFGLPCFRVGGVAVIGRAEVLQRFEESAVRVGSSGNRDVVFPVHPAALAQGAELLARRLAGDALIHGHRWWATATSSVRTLLAWSEMESQAPCLVKLALGSSELGDRTLTLEKVAHSVGVSRCVETSLARLPGDIRFFLEPLGLVPRWHPKGGVVLRTIPPEILSGRVLPMPLFALMGGCDGGVPVLLQWMQRTAIGARELLEGVLLARFARIWIDLVFDEGLILEAHAQNLLLAVSAQLEPLGSFYYRDFEGMAVDWALRRARGMPTPELPQSCKWFDTYETWGYPLYQLVSVKLMVSLFDYLNLVLGELEAAVLEWQAQGRVTGRTLRAGELTGSFSGYLRQVIWEKFAVREESEYDVRHDLKRFVKFLLRVRREVMWAHGHVRGAGC